MTAKPPVKRYVAEDVPAYSVEPWQTKPWRDEDLGMSAKINVGVFDTADEARQALVEALEEFAASYRARGEFNKNYQKDAVLYQAAADVLKAGSESVKVWQRYHRIRETTTGF